MIPAWLALIGWIGLGPVVLRSGDRIDAERVVGFSPQGVELRASFDAGVLPGARVVPWLEVADIEGGWGDGEYFRKIAKNAGLAERRLARGDVTGAGALFESLAPAYLNESGPTSGAVASGLVICRLLRSDRAGAAVAWLAWRSSPAGPSRAWIDAETSLAPGLPPVFTPRDARAFVAQSFANDTGGEHAAALGAMYLAAARVAAGEQPATLAGPETRLRADPGVRFAWEIVRAQADPDVSGRRAARDALRRRLRTSGADWQDAWIRLGIGVSMLREPERMEADAGAAELLAVVIEDRNAAPGLADLAGSLLIEYFESTDRPGHAASVRAMDRAAMIGLTPGLRGPGEPASDSGPEQSAEPNQEHP